MILTCPNCTTRYLVSPAKLRPGGRTVRCARCAHSWFEEAPPPDLEEAPESVTPPTADESAGGDNPDPETAGSGDSAPDDDRKQGDAQDKQRIRQSPARDGGRNLPALPRNGNRWSEPMGWAGLVLFVALVVGGGYAFRNDIAGAWPPSERLYRAFGMDVTTTKPEPDLPALEKRLQFTELRPSQTFVAGVLTLAIEGRINNIGNRTETLPPVKVVLLDDRQSDLVTWTVDPPLDTLAPGQSVAFETSLENPPPEAQDIRVTFAVSTGD